MSAIRLACACGQVALRLADRPITAAECHCDSCRTAGARLEALPGAPPVRETNGGTRYVMWRKDRVAVESGSGLLRAMRLRPGAPARRVFASCCNAALYFEHDKGHWLSLFARRWPQGTAPAPALRVGTGDLPAGSVLDEAVPASRLRTLGFVGRLLAAWAAMGFRSPVVADVRETPEA